MRIVFPCRSCAGRRHPRARIAPSQTAAASSKLIPAGLRVSAALSRMQTNSACAPNRHALTPKTWSPGVNSVTAGPVVSISPATSVPRIFHLGRGKPLMNRLKNGWPRRTPVSVRFTVVARTLIRTSLSLGTGRWTSSSRRTSGGPYLSKATALISSPSLCRLGSQSSRPRLTARCRTSQQTWAVSFLGSYIHVHASSSVHHAPLSSRRDLHGRSCMVIRNPEKQTVGAGRAATRAATTLYELGRGEDPVMGCLFVRDVRFFPAGTTAEPPPASHPISPRTLLAKWGVGVP